MTSSLDSLAPRQFLRFLSVDDVVRLGRAFETPLFVYDEASICAAIAQLRALPNAFGIAIRYSLKSNPNAAMIALAASAGADFDASSVWEVLRAVRAGVAPERILLTAQEAKFTPQLIELIQAGVLFDAGSLHQLAEYGRHFPRHPVSIRINPGFGSGLVRRLTAGGPDSSFGIWHEQIDEAIVIANRYSLKVERLHTHIGSGHHSDVLIPAAEELLRLAPRFRDVRAIDLGGGYRISAFADDPVYDHTGWAAELQQMVSDFAVRHRRELVVELEPGTFVTANAGSLLSSVIDIVTTGKGGRRFVKIDGGLTEILRPSYYGAPHPLVAVGADGTLPSPEVVPASVAGHCCIAGDMLTIEPGDPERIRDIDLGEVAIGDYVVIERAGGYCSSMAMKNFNSYPEAAEVLRRSNGDYDVIRERQTLEQFLVNERVPTDLAPHVKVALSR
jgi:diaminopimelate decarboxylase